MASSARSGGSGGGMEHSWNQRSAERGVMRRIWDGDWPIGEEDKSRESGEPYYMSNGFSSFVPRPYLMTRG